MTGPGQHAAPAKFVSRRELLRAYLVRNDAPAFVEELDELVALAGRAAWLEDELDECDKRADKAEARADELQRERDEALREIGKWRDAVDVAVWREREIGDVARREADQLRKKLERAYRYRESQEGLPTGTLGYPTHTNLV